MLKERALAHREKRELVDRGKEYLFKGISPSAFSHYFKAGGILPNPHPIYPRDTWITNDIVRAQQFAGFGPMDKGEGCLALIEKDGVLGRGNLKPKRSLERALSPSLKEYYGQETIGWDEVLQLFTTEATAMRMQRDFQIISPPDMTWTDFAKKLTIVDAGTTDHLNHHLLGYLNKDSQVKKIGSHSG